MSETAVIVSDAHLRDADRPAAATFRAFLRAVPDLGSHLVVNGDLFEFWFEYRRVVPREAFATLAAFAELRQAGVRLTVLGGNHDRWGGPFWVDQLGAAFYPDGARIDLAGRRAFVAHGDGLAERHVAARLFRWVTRRRATAAVFRWLHPDLGLPLVERLSGRLGVTTRAPDVLAAAADAQRAWALDRLQRDASLDLIVLGHTHQPALEPLPDGRWYINPGAWVDGRRYAIVTTAGPRLCQFVEA